MFYVNNVTSALIVKNNRNCVAEHILIKEYDLMCCSVVTPKACFVCV